MERAPAAPGQRPGARGEAARPLDRGLPGGAGAARVAAFETLRGYGHPAAHNLSAGAGRGGQAGGHAGGACVRAAARRRGEALVPAGTPVGAVRVSAAGWEGWVLAGLAGLVARAPPPVRLALLSWSGVVQAVPRPNPSLLAEVVSLSKTLQAAAGSGLRTAESCAHSAGCGPPHACRRARRCCCWSCMRRAWRRAGSRAARSRCSAACTPGATPMCRTRGAAPPAPSCQPFGLRVVAAPGALGRAFYVCLVAVSNSRGACMCPCHDAHMHACVNEVAPLRCISSCVIARLPQHSRAGMGSAAGTRSCAACSSVHGLQQRARRRNSPNAMSCPALRSIGSEPLS